VNGVLLGGAMSIALFLRQAAHPRVTELVQAVPGSPIVCAIWITRRRIGKGLTTDRERALCELPESPDTAYRLVKQARLEHRGGIGAASFDCTDNESAGVLGPAG
jgi:hypothetical protein